jgi:hypothetical protein
MNTERETVEAEGTLADRRGFMNYLRNLALLLAKMHLAASESTSWRRNVLTTVNIVASILVFFVSLNSDIQSLMDHYVNLSFANIPIPSCGADCGKFQVEFHQIFIGFAAACVLASSMLQYHLRYEERHLEHKHATNSYFNLYKKISRMLVSNEYHKSEVMHMINKEFNSVNNATPIVGQRHLGLLSDYSTEVEKYQREKIG